MYFSYTQIFNTMIIDIIHYQLAPGISEPEFLALTQRVRQEWMQHQKGFLDWKQCKNSSGGYTDVVSWAAAEDAKAAEKAMANYPEAPAWEACYTDVSYFQLSPI